MSNDTRSRPMTAETIHTCSYECERPGCTRAQRPAEGEEIMVSTPYDVFILPLRTSGLSSGPRFVVHVPGPELPAQQWRDLAIASVTILEEIREIVGLKGKCGDVVEAVRKLAAGEMRNER